MKEPPLHIERNNPPLLMISLDARGVTCLKRKSKRALEFMKAAITKDGRGANGRGRFTEEFEAVALREARAAPHN
jgi:hypothetical protein